jgi:hypothetical protein
VGRTLAVASCPTCGRTPAGVACERRREPAGIANSKICGQVNPPWTSIDLIGSSAQQAFLRADTRAKCTLAHRANRSVSIGFQSATPIPYDEQS